MTTAPQKSDRMIALDVLRGLTVALMIVVNNGGGGSRFTYAQLQHSAWHGLTLCDMVFPSFLFIVGISTCLSLGRLKTSPVIDIVRKVLRRTLLILLIGWAIAWFGKALDGNFFPIDTFRLTGVLPRIAICYGLTSAIALTCRKDTVAWIVIALLISYSAMLLMGNGLVNAADSILVRIDRWLLGANHLYAKQPVDPEGLTSTVGALAHTLTGYCVGTILADKTCDKQYRALRVMVTGFCLLLAALALSDIMPVNKRIWSPTYVLITCGLASLALGTLSYVIDIRGHKRAFDFFMIYGVNPLFLYVLSELASEVMSATGGKKAAFGLLYQSVGDPYVASAAYAVLFSLLFAVVGYPLYKKKIYIKL